MIRRSSVAGLLLVVLVAGLAYVGYRRFVMPAHGCDVCGRDRHAGMEAVVSLENGKRVETCCARCALHFQAGQPHQVARITVEDHDTGEEIDARSAVYLEGTDTAGCAPASENTPREPGVPYGRTFDRCLPSLIAFETAARAREFQRAHGGRLLSLDEASEHVRHR
jgi:nitrous oxide reductase accessory protein NosL